MSETLPRGWCTAPLEDLADVVRGITFPASAKNTSPSDGLVRCLRTSNVQEQLELDDVLYVSREFVRRDDQWLREGDVVISMANSYELVGKVAFAFAQSEPTTFGGFIAAIRPTAVAPKFLLHQLRSSACRNEMRSGASQTVNIANISLGTLNPLLVRLAPPEEQARIAGALDAYLSRLDDAVASLERAQKKLKAYRASVLKAAVEGRLVPTEAELARQEKRPYEPASELLKRILTERRRRWEEAELAKLKAAGKPPKDDKWKAKYEEPAAPDTSKLPALPEGWCWASVEQVGDILLGRQRAPQYLTGNWPRPYLRVANIKDDRIETDDVESMDFDEDHFPKYRLEPGDILVSEGQSPHLVGQSAIYWGGIDGLCFQKTLHRFRPVTYGPSSRFAQLVFRAHVRTKVFQTVASITTNIAHLTLEKFKESRFPLPPSEEQERIEAEAQRLLSVADVSETQLRANVARTARLRQAVLKWAFEGKLVDQDPNDEPAEALLARIRAEQTQSSTEKKPRGRKAKSAS